MADSVYNTRGRCGGLASWEPATAPLAEPETAAPPSEAEAPAWTPGTDYASVVVVPGRPGERLPVEDLVLAVDIMRLRSLAPAPAPAPAIAVVQANVAAAQAAATENTHNGISESTIHDWFDALANGRPLPSLDQE